MPTSVLKALPGKLDIKRHSPSILYIQDGLRKRMESLKHSIIEASEAVEEEKRKNVELLRMVFPANLAPKLWRGKNH